MEHHGGDQRPSTDRSPKQGERSHDGSGELSALALAGLGMQFFAALALFAFGGSWADRRLGTSPLFLLLGVFVGGGGSFFLAVRRALRRNR